MENKFLSNKIVLKYCKDYYKIINEEFSEDDDVSSKIIQIYQTYIFSINLKDKQKVKLITSLNDAILRYFEDNEFRKMLSNYIKNLKVSKEETNIIEYVAKGIIKEYEIYMEGFTRSIYIPKWI